MTLNLFLMGLSVMGWLWAVSTQSLIGASAFAFSFGANLVSVLQRLADQGEI